MKLIPYVLHNGAWSLPDDIMESVFTRMRLHDLDIVVFGERLNPDRFLGFIKRQSVVLHTIWEDNQILMIGWLTDISTNHAFAHYCMFPETWGKNTAELAKESLRYWFNFKGNDGYLFDVIMGRTPVDNGYAVKFLKKIGMNILGAVPLLKFGNSDSGMVFSYITREEFLNG